MFGIRKFSLMMAGAVVSLAAIGGLAAQPGDSKGPPKAAAPGQGAPAFDVDALLAGMQADERAVMRLKAQARKLKDVVKVNCINDKLLEIKALQNVADQNAMSGDGAAVDQNAKDAHAKAEDAKGCLGDDLSVSGPASNNFSSPDLPDSPGDDSEFDDVIENPGYATPYT